MGDTSTVYDVRVRYHTDDKASRAIGHIADASNRAARSSFGLKSVLGMVGTGLLLREAKKSLIDYNAGLEQMQTQLAAVGMMNKGGSFADNIAEATGLMAEFQQFAKQSVVTTKDLVSFSTDIAAPVYAAGKGAKELANFTEQAVTAATVLGTRADMAALDITQALGGSVGARDRFAKMLLSSVGYTTEAFNKLNQSKRFDVLSQALNQPAIKEAAKAFENSFAGVTSTLKDNLEIALGKVGLPLFKAIGEELKSWNVWIEKHPREIEEFGKKFASALVTGFKIVRDTLAFVVEHKDLLLGIAGAYAVGAMRQGGLKGASDGKGGFSRAAIGMSAVQAGAFGLAASQMVGGMHPLGKAFTTVAGAASALPGPLGQVATAAAGAALGLQGIANWLHKRQTRDIDNAGDVAFVREIMNKRLPSSLSREEFAVAEQHAIGPRAEELRKKGMIDLYNARQELASEYKGLVLKAQEIGGITKKGTVDVAALYAQYTARGMGTAEAGAIVAMTVKAMSSLDPAWLRGHLPHELMGPPAPTAETGDKRTNPRDINVNISKIEVASEDPDRFVMGLAHAAVKAIQSPTQAEAALRGGF